MTTLRLCACLFSTLTCLAAHASDLYFGGRGDTNAHWVGYQVSVATNSITWTAYTLDFAKRGRIRIAPATFRPEGINRWHAIFDEVYFRTNAVGFGLAAHNLHITFSRDRNSIQVQDGKETYMLSRIAPQDQRMIKSGRIPNKSGPSNGIQPIRSETNRTSSAAGSRR